MKRLSGRNLAGVIASTLIVAFSGIVKAETYHVDPSSPSAAADGSAERPFPSIAAAFAAKTLKGGDEVLLAPGNYGKVQLKKVGFETPLTLRAEPRHGARFSQLSLERTRNLVIDGVRVAPEGKRTGKVGPMVSEQGTGTVLRNLDVWGKADISDYYSWSKEDWLAGTQGGVRSRGADFTLEDSHITGTLFAVGTLSDRAIVRRNQIRGFGGDGIRSLGDDTLVEGNLITDCFKINDNHDDGFQSWSRGKNGRPGQGTVKGLTITANRIIEWSGPAGHPLHCRLQGIGLFDGMFQDLTISNNLIIVSAFHGIAVYGGRDATIVNNTLIHAREISRKSPWITVRSHRNGTSPSNVTVANNLSPRYVLPDIPSGDAGQVIANQMLIYPYQHLQRDGPEAFYLKPESGLRGAANAAAAPETDLTGQRRRSPIDPGAFQSR